MCCGLQLCLDYRFLNRKIIEEKLALSSRVPMVLYRQTSKWDNQVSVAEQDCPKTDVL